MAAFRRGGEWAPTDVFRLREIAEFGLGNAVLALSVLPLSTTLGDLGGALRICGVLGIAFVIGGGAVLIRRRRDLGVPGDCGWYRLAGAVDVGALGAIATAIAGTIGLFEWCLLFQLARPMLAFVLSSHRSVMTHAEL